MNRNKWFLPLKLAGYTTGLILIMAVVFMAGMEFSTNRNHALISLLLPALMLPYFVRDYANLLRRRQQP